MQQSRFQVRALVEAGVMIALATVLSMFTIYKFPQGGSVTPGSMIPILFIALRWGPGVGLMTGFVYGIAQYIEGPYFVSLAQVALDYGVAFTALGLAGFFRKNIWVGIFVGIFGRWAAHVLAGVIFFWEYAPGNPWLYSMGYNGAYLGVELLISLALLSLIPQLRTFAKQQDQLPT